MTLVECLDHMEQEMNDQVTWHRAKGSLKDHFTTDAFEAGFKDGWRRCISDLKLHAGLQLKT